MSFGQFILFVFGAMFLIFLIGLSISLFPVWVTFFIVIFIVLGAIAGWISGDPNK